MIGALVALLFRISLRVVGLIMGFGAGVLISAVAFDLVEEAARRPRATGQSSRASSRAAASSSAATGFIDRMGGGDRKDATGSQATGSALAIVLGTVLDGVPESIGQSRVRP